MFWPCNAVCLCLSHATKVSAPARLLSFNHIMSGQSQAGSPPCRQRCFFLSLSFFAAEEPSSCSLFPLALPSALVSRPDHYAAVCPHPRRRRGPLPHCGAVAGSTPKPAMPCTASPLLLPCPHTGATLPPLAHRAARAPRSRPTLVRCPTACVVAADLPASFISAASPIARYYASSSPPPP